MKRIVIIAVLLALCSAGALAYSATDHPRPIGLFFTQSGNMVYIDTRGTSDIARVTPLALPLTSQASVKFLFTGTYQLLGTIEVDFKNRGPYAGYFSSICAVGVKVPGPAPGICGAKYDVVYHSGSGTIRLVPTGEKHPYYDYTLYQAAGVSSTGGGIGQETVAGSYDMPPLTFSDVTQGCVGGVRVDSQGGTTTLGTLITDEKKCITKITVHNVYLDGQVDTRLYSVVSATPQVVKIRSEITGLDHTYTLGSAINPQQGTLFMRLLATLADGANQPIILQKQSDGSYIITGPSIDGLSSVTLSSGGGDTGFCGDKKSTPFEVKAYAAPGSAFSDFKPGAYASFEANPFDESYFYGNEGQKTARGMISFTDKTDTARGTVFTTSYACSVGTLGRPSLGGNVLSSLSGWKADIRQEPPSCTTGGDCSFTFKLLTDGAKQDTLPETCVLGILYPDTRTPITSAAYADKDLKSLQQNQPYRWVVKCSLLQNGLQKKVQFAADTRYGAAKPRIYLYPLAPSETIHNDLTNYQSTTANVVDLYNTVGVASSSLLWESSRGREYRIANAAQDVNLAAAAQAPAGQRGAAPLPEVKRETTDDKLPKYPAEGTDAGKEFNIAHLKLTDSSRNPLTDFYVININGKAVAVYKALNWFGGITAQPFETGEGAAKGTYYSITSKGAVAYIFAQPLDKLPGLQSDQASTPQLAFQGAKVLSSYVESGDKGVTTLFKAADGTPDFCAAATFNTFSFWLSDGANTRSFTLTPAKQQALFCTSPTLAATAPLPKEYAGYSQVLYQKSSDGDDYLLIGTRLGALITQSSMQTGAWTAIKNWGRASWDEYALSILPGDSRPASLQQAEPLQHVGFGTQRYLLLPKEPDLRLVKKYGTVQGSGPINDFRVRVSNEKWQVTLRSVDADSLKILKPLASDLKSATWGALAGMAGGGLAAGLPGAAVGFGGGTVAGLLWYPASTLISFDNPLATSSATESRNVATTSPLLINLGIDTKKDVTTRLVIDTQASASLKTATAGVVASDGKEYPGLQLSLIDASGQPVHQTCYRIDECLSLLDGAYSVETRTRTINSKVGVRNPGTAVAWDDEWTRLNQAAYAQRDRVNLALQQKQIYGRMAALTSSEKPLIDKTKQRIESAEDALQPATDFYAYLKGGRLDVDVLQSDSQEAVARLDIEYLQSSGIDIPAVIGANSRIIFEPAERSSLKDNLFVLNPSSLTNDIEIQENFKGVWLLRKRNLAWWEYPRYLPLIGQLYKQPLYYLQKTNEGAAAQ